MQQQSTYNHGLLVAPQESSLVVVKLVATGLQKVRALMRINRIQMLRVW
ncbi:putative oligouridylate-binding protein 1B [Iris pallida]|uniref:Oligouridylate-binding protein 1B n=1 Tax=Iris pallida TaxID=29817 RepID=A0AAX6GBF9_IRIPA|nr:putative oligouridylate-binding protein 1B [Iris pallida]